MTVGERLALQQERIEEEERQQMTALQRRQRRRLEYMEVAIARLLCLRLGCVLYFTNRIQPQQSP